MSVELQRQRELYHGNGAATDFDFYFTVEDGSQVKVVVADEEGQESVLTYGDDYTVTLNATEGVKLATGKIVLTDPLPNGHKIALVSNIPHVQQRTFPDHTPYYQTQIEGALDKNTRLIQQLSESVDRAVKVSETSELTAEEIMESVEQNAILVEKTKNECLAALEEIHDANFAPQTQVDELTDTVADVSNVADAAAQNASSALDAIGTLELSVETVGGTADSALELANHAISIAQGAMSYKGEVATTGDLPDDAAAGDIYTVTADGNLYISDGEGNWSEFSAVAVDQAIIANSANPVAGGAVKTALDAKADDSAVMKLSVAQNVTHNKTWTTPNSGPHVTNTNQTLILSMRCSDTPRAGLYDSTGDDWLIRRNGDGSFTLTAKASGGTAKSLQGTQGSSGTLTWGGADITGDAKKANLPINVKDYGAKGDGSTNDTAAFTSAVTAAQGRYVYVPAGTYVVNSDVRGKFLVLGDVAFKGSGKVYGVQDACGPMPQPRDTFFYDLPYDAAGLGKWHYAAQGFAMDGPDLYALETENANSKTVIHKFTVDGTNTPKWIATSGVTNFGHQGLAVDDDGKLIGTGRRTEDGGSGTTTDGRRRMCRAAFSTSSITTTDTVKLFEDGYTNTQSSSPNLSPDKKLLVAVGYNSSTSQRIVRIWNYADTKTYNDVTSRYTKQFRIQATESYTVQGLAIDNNGNVYVLTGLNTLVNEKRFFVYNSSGTLLKQTSLFSAGYAYALQHYYPGTSEPEALNFVYDGSMLRLSVLFMSGTYINPSAASLSSADNRHCLIFPVVYDDPMGVSLTSDTFGTSYFLVNDNGTLRLFRDATLQTSIVCNGYTTISANTGNMNFDIVAGDTAYHFRKDGTNRAILDEASFRTSCNVRPITGNSYTLGTSSYRWENCYLHSGPSVSSDERLKDNIGDPDEALMRAWGKVNFKVFQMRDAIQKKGVNARLHVGVIAQQIEEAFASEGLDARRYGLLCYDEWDATPAVTDENGEIVEPSLSAGNEYSVRYEEALALECAYQRWRLNRLEELINNQQ